MADQPTYAMRLRGGPYDGETLITHGTWPLPDDLGQGETGTYRKISESQIKEDHPGLMRGAEYEWVPNDRLD